MRAICRFLRSDDGPAAVEYAVMLALILVATISAITTLGGENNGFWGHISSEATAAFQAAGIGI